MTIVKICGLRSAEHAVAAVEAGADLLGFIFAPARRQVSPATVAMIAEAIRAHTPQGEHPASIAEFVWASAPENVRVGLVGVFVNEAPERIKAIVGTCGLHAIQLSGDEETTVLSQLPVQGLIKAVRTNDAPSERWLRTAPRLHLLVDAQVPGSYGGAGVVADWDHAAELARQRPIILAGGLTPDNVAEAIRRVRPWGVDVSSGVETDGVKDSAKIRAFIAAVRAADQERGIPAD